MADTKHPTYLLAKIKVVEKRWHGWSPEGGNISPKESVIEKPSGSFLIISAIKQEMGGVWAEDNQNAATMLRSDYLQKEGFRIFIPKDEKVVNFTPERTLEPISGKIFPIKNRLPLEKRNLKIGESFTIEPFSMDAGVKYEVSLLDIFENKQ